MNKKKVIVSWSGGKDSMLVLDKLLKEEQYEVAGLMTNFNETSKLVTMHYIPEEIIQQQADALNLPLFKVMLPPEADNDTFRKRTLEVMEDTSADAVAFGDIFQEAIRTFREELCQEAELEALFPLWDSEPQEIADRFLAEDYRAILVCLESESMESDWLGHVYNQELLDHLPNDLDTAGEQGHFHTLVIDGPTFQQPVEVVITGKKHVKLKGADMNKFIYCTFKG